MKVPAYLDEEALENLLRQQKRLAWDAEKDIPWRKGVDFSKPFVPLDPNNLFFPNISKTERLAVSQYMGMMIAATFSELELTMQRMRDISWRPQMGLHAANPELIALGENFFDEEQKHADVFQRFLHLCAASLNIDPEDLKEILPRVNPGYVESILKLDSTMDGLALWWIVATVEEESTLIFRQMKPHQDKMDPLYFQLHARHFEEEARHAPYPFLMVELGNDHLANPLKKLVRRSDFVLSAVLKMFWLVFELSKSLHISRFKNHHPFFNTLHGLLPKMQEKSLTGLLSSLATQTPYISLFINPLYHPYTKKAVAKRGTFNLPFPQPIPAEVGW